MPANPHRERLRFSRLRQRWASRSFHVGYLQFDSATNPQAGRKPVLLIRPQHFLSQ